MMINPLSAQYSQQELLSTFDMARRRYRYRCQKANALDHERECLKSQVSALHQASRGSAGSRTLAGPLNHAGHNIGRYQVRSLMKEAGLVSKPLKRHRYRLSEDDCIIAKNHLDRQFAVDGPNPVWCGDVTDVWSGQRWLYLVVVLDL